MLDNVSGRCLWLPPADPAPPPAGCVFESSLPAISMSCYRLPIVFSGRQDRGLLPVLGSALAVRRCSARTET